MSIDVSATFLKESVKKENIGVIDMYILNASSSGFDPLYFANWNHDIYGFGLNATGDLISNIETYTGLPITREAIKTTLQGEVPGVSISIPNTDRVIESYIQARKYLRGCDIYCLTSFIKHLPVAEAQLSYTGKTGSFTSGTKLIQWNASGTVVASALIAHDSDNTVYLNNISGTFTSNKIIGTKDYESNLVPDGDCEATPTSWTSIYTPTSHTRSSEKAYTGTYSRKLNVVATYAGILSGNFTTEKDYFYIANTKIYPVDTTSIYYTLDYGQDWHSVNMSVSVGTWNSLTRVVQANDSLFTVGGGESHVGLQSFPATTCTWYADDFSVKKITNAALASSSIAYTNIANFIGTSPDRFAVLKEKLYIDTASSDENVVAFTCKPKLLIRGKILPGRTFSKECAWAIKGRYAGTECNPSNQINATRLASYPECDGTIDNCEERKNKVRFGGFPSIPDKGIFIS